MTPREENGSSEEIAAIQRIEAADRITGRRPWKPGRQTLDEAKRFGPVSGSDPDDYLIDGAIYVIANRKRLLAKDAAKRQRLKNLGVLRDDVPLAEMPPE
jgi:hypothetical protein